MASLTRTCGKCGTAIPGIKDICPKCGAKFEGKKLPPPVPTKRASLGEREPDKDKEKAEKVLRIRKKVAQEILSTEKTYIKALDTICDKFLNPLRKAVAEDKPIISNQDIQMVFSVISVIRDLNKKFYADLEPLINNYTLGTQIGKVILDFAPYFKMYTQYVNAHENDQVQEYMRKLDSKAGTTPFKTFCYDVAKNEMCLPLPALLITPVQRIPRYRLLVQEYLKNTDKTHADYEDLSKALDKIKETAMIINEAVRRQQQRQTVMDLEKKFSSNPGFISPSRIFKHQGPLMKKCRADDRKYEFFLFNDLFVYGKETGKDRYALHKKIPIDQIFKVEEVADAENQHSFQITNSVKSFIVYASSDAEKKVWEKAIQEVLAARAKSLNKGDAAVAAPVWESDKKKMCQRQRKPDGTPCGTTFGLIKRRHHCRVCGVLCCHECSPYNVFLIEDGKKKERACTECILALMKIEKNKSLYKPEQLPSSGSKNVPTLPMSKSGIHSASSSTVTTRDDTKGNEVPEGVYKKAPPPPPARPAADSPSNKKAPPSLPPRRGKAGNGPPRSPRTESRRFPPPVPSKGNAPPIPTQKVPPIPQKSVPPIPQKSVPPIPHKAPSTPPKAESKGASPTIEPKSNAPPKKGPPPPPSSKPPGKASTKAPAKVSNRPAAPRGNGIVSAYRRTRSPAVEGKKAKKKTGKIERARGAKLEALLSKFQASGGSSAARVPKAVD